MQRHRLPPPQVTADLVSRPRLSTLVAERWERRIILLVAGAGFGKSTLLAQALEENRLAPRGRDHWQSCDPADAVASILAAGLAAALGVDPPPAGDPAAWLLGRLRDAPVGTCLVLDDVHHVPEGSAGFELLASLVRELPAQCRLVISTRRDPGLPLTRWRTHGEVLELGEEDLRFTDDELAELVCGSPVDGDTLAHTSGWPALAALAVRTSGQHARRYVWEEVLAGVSERLRRHLAVATTIGGGDLELLCAAAGEPVDAVGLASLPMVRVLPDGVVTAHKLWEDPLADVLSPEERIDVLRRSGALLARRRDHDPAIEHLAAAGDWDGVCDVVCDAAWAGYLGPPADVLGRWWSLLPADRRDDPASMLLESIMLRARNPFDPRSASLAARARTGFAERGVVGAEIAATAELTYLLRSVGDYDAIGALLPRLFELHDGGAPEAAGLACIARAMLAEHLDDDDQLLGELDAIPPGAFHHEWQALVEWLRSNSLLMLGRPEAAAEAARRCVDLAGPGYLGGRCAVVLTRWWCEVDADVVDDLPRTDREQHATTVDRLMIGAIGGTLHAFAGRIDDAVANISTARASAAGARPALLGTLALAEAALAVSRGDEATGAAALASFFADHPPDSLAARRSLRRFPALAYVLAPDARPTIDGMDLGPALAGAARSGRAFVELRAGRPALAARLDPQDLLHGLPLAWSAELVARLAVHDLRTSSALTVALVQAYGSAARDALRDLEREDTQAGARRLLAAVPVAPQHPVEIRLLGPLALHIDGRPTSPPELRRTRVRHLLALLALKAPLPRETAAATLWPDATDRAAAANLRTNLSHLQRALEPDRVTGDAPFVLRTEADLLVLAGPPWLTVDVDAFEALRHASDVAAASGDHRRALAHLEDGLALSRGEPLTDLRWEEWAVAVADRLRADLTAAFLRAAELRHALDDHTTASHWAGQALELEPWSEAAHRMLVATRLALGDREGAQRAMARCRDLLADLGVRAEPATAMLARRIEAPFATG